MKFVLVSLSVFIALAKGEGEETTLFPTISPTYPGEIDPSITGMIAALVSGEMDKAKFCFDALRVNSECQRTLIGQSWILKEPTLCLTTEKKFCDYLQNQNCVTGPGGPNGWTNYFVPFCANTKAPVQLPFQCWECATLNYTLAKPMIDLGGMGALGNLFGGNSMMSLGDLSSLLSGTQNFNGMFDLFKPGVSGRRKRGLKL